MANNFVERVRRELSAEEVSGLRVYAAHSPNGSVVFMPIIRGFGREVQWQAHTHVKGAAGPLPVTRATLQAIGAPPEWLDKSKDFPHALEQALPDNSELPDKR